MPRSSKDDDSARASSEFLIEHPSRRQQPRQKRWSVFNLTLGAVFILVGSLELVVLETILVRWGTRNACPPALLSELNSLVPICKSPRETRKNPSRTFEDQAG